MKIVNIMNFVREIDERLENSTEKLLNFTAEQIQLVNKYDVDNTFLLQYDVLCNKDFINLFKEKTTKKTELGLWYEIVAPLTEACGIPYRSEKGWKWDWHIIPGYSMAYTTAQREKLIDEAMNKFKEVFGSYPKTVAAWLIDTHTLNYLARNYNISSIAICRDQANTDAYTLLGGYFNQAYYPSVNNIFTPAQNEEYQINIPVFRLLGACPIHNYDNHKYSSDEFKAFGQKAGCFTLEPCWFMGSNEFTAKWLFDSYFGEESLGFSYAQIGQENSFLYCKEQVLKGIQMQIELLLNRKDVEFKKMGETGEWFKKTYPSSTPATCVIAPNHYDTTDVQSVYYDCKNYTANLFRFSNKIFFRSLFLFDERIKDRYLENTCTTFDAIYENLPIIDTMELPDERRSKCGLMIDENAVPFTTEKIADNVLKVRFGKGSVTFYEDMIEIISDNLIWYNDSTKATSKLNGSGLSFEYKGYKYDLEINGGIFETVNENYIIRSKNDKITLIPKKR